MPAIAVAGQGTHVARQPERRIGTVSGPSSAVDFEQPRHMGGDCFVRGVTIGKRVDDETVWDCPGCAGHVYADRWHVAAAVRQRSESQCHRYCSVACLQEWLDLAVRP